MNRETQMQELLSRLSANPYDLKPLMQLERQWDAQIPTLIAALHTRATEIEDSDAIARLLLEAGRLSAMRLGDVEAGLQYIGAALEVGEQTFVSIEAHLFDFALRNQDSELVSYFTQALEHCERASDQSRLYLRMGSILGGILADAQQASDAFGYALQLDPTNTAAQWAYQDFMRRTRNWNRLAELLYAEVETSDNPVEQAIASVELGRIYRDQLGDSDGAEQCFRVAADLDPGNQDARRELGLQVEDDAAPDAPADELSGEFELAVEVADDVQPPRSGTVKLDEAMVVEESASADADIAAVVAAAHADPGTVELDDALLLDNDPVGDSVESRAPTGPPAIPSEDDFGASAPEAISVDQFAEELAADVASEEGGLTLDEDSSSGELSPDSSSGEFDPDSSDVELAEDSSSGEFDPDSSDVELAEDSSSGEFDADSSDVELAEDSSEPQLDEDAADVAGVEDVSDVASSSAGAAQQEPEELGWHARFLQLVEQAKDAGAPAEARTLLARAARMESRYHERDADGLLLWDAAVELGVAREFYQHTSYLWVEKSFWEQVFARVSDDGLKARIAFFDLADPAQARAFAQAAEDADILAALDDLEAAQENWRKFQRTVEQRYEALEGDEKALKVYWHMANMAAVLGDLDKEIDALRRLDRQVDDPLVSNRLKVLYKRAEKWPMYVDLIKKEVEHIDAARTLDKIDLLHEAIFVYRDKMNHDMMVVNTYKEILEIDPHNMEAIDALISMYDKLNRASELINMLQEKIALTASESGKVALYEQIAELFLEKFRNQAEAIKAYESILELRPHHPGAIAFLKDMYEKRSRWEQLIEVHKLEIETFQTDAEKAAGFKEVAELAAAKLRDPEVATELWLQVRRFAPEDPSALDALETLFEKSRDYEKLAEVLEKKVAYLSSDDEKMKLFQKLGMLCSDRLQDPARAIEAWKQALALDPQDLKARKALERLYIEGQHWQELEDFYAAYDAHADLVRVLETLAGTVAEDATKIELLLRAARVWREVLQDSGRAERDLDRALGIDPRNERVALQLEPIVREKQEFERLKECLEIILEHRTEPEGRRAYQLKLAQLHADQLDDPRGAFRWYADAFRDNPGARDGIAALEEAAARAETFATLDRVYSDALEQDLDEDARQFLQLRLGAVRFEQLGDLDGALEQYQAVRDGEPDNLEALAAMEAIYRQAERWDELMHVYRLRLGLTDVVAEQVKILQGMAGIAEDQAGDVEGAMERLREALELDAQNEATLTELHRLYAGAGAYEELVEIIRREIDLIEQRARARKAPRPTLVDAQSFLAGANLSGALADGGAHAHGAPEQDSALGDLALGGDTGLSTLDLDAEQLRALETVDSEPGLLQEASEAALEALEEAGQDFEKPTQAVDDGPAQTYTEDEIDRLVALRFELGVVCKEHLAEDAAAVDALAQVLAWRPLHHPALEAIEHYLEVAAYHDRVARELTPVYAVQGKWNRLIDALQAQMQAAELAQKVDLLQRIGLTQVEELAHHARAFDTFATLLELQPENEHARAQLRRIAGPVERWEEYIDLLETQLPRVEADELRIAYLFDLGEAYYLRLGDSDTAQTLYHQILEIRPDSVRALDALESLYAETRQWRELVGVYERELALADIAGEAETLQFKIALVWERLLEEPEQAITVLKHMLQERPDNLRAVRMLGDLYRSLGRWQELAGAIEHELSWVSDAAAHDVKNRLAAVCEHHLGQVDRAVDLYEEVLSEDAINAGATDALERMMDNADAPSERASLILEPLYIEQGAHEKLIHALEVQVRESVDPEQRVALRHRVAALHEEQCGRPDDAFDTYGKALHDQVDNTTTLDHLYRLAKAQDAWHALADLFEAEADAQPEPQTKYDLFWQAAAISIDPLAAPEQASRLLRQVQALFPDDLPTLEALEDQYRALQDFEQLVDILVAKAELMAEVQPKKDLYYQAATIFEDVLDRPEEAVQVYRAVLDVDDADAHAIDRLEVLLTALERWQELLEVYNRKLELTENPEARKDLLYAMGPIYRECLDEPFEAIEAYKSLLAIDAQELAALEKLDELYVETEQWMELLETLTQEIELVAQPADKLDLRYRVGRLWETEMGDAQQAIEVYGALLAEDPTHAATTEALEGLITRGEQEVQAAEVLQPIYEAAGEWEKLVHVYKLLIESSMDPERKLGLYAEVARIYEQELQEAFAAFDTHVEALSVDPARAEVLANLERLAAALDYWEMLIERYDDALLETSDPDAFTDLNLRVARIYEEELGDSERAIERLTRVAEADPDNQTAIFSLDRLYQAEGQWENLAGILKTRIYGTHEPEQLLELSLRLGLVFQEALDQPDEAIEVYQAILLEEPDNAQAIQSLEQMFMAGQAVQKISDILEPYYLAKGQHLKLVEIYLQRLDMLSDSLQRHELLMQVARIFLNELGDEARALSAFGAALVEKPDEPEVLARIEELAENTNSWGEAAGFYVDALQRDGLVPEDALTLWLSLAGVLDRRLHNLDEAENAYLEALKIDPTEPRALQALDRIYTAQDRYQDLADTLHRRIDGVYDEDEIVELSFRLAQIYQFNLDQPVDAVRTYESILDVRPTHEDSLLRLERLHTEQQQWQDLSDVLQRRAENTHEPTVRIELFSRMANLAEEMLGQPDDAVDLWNEVLNIDPSNQDALHELQRLYMNAARFEDLVGVLERQVELSNNPAEQLTLYEALGVIWQEKLDNEMQAHDAWRNALNIDPTNLSALHALHGIYTRQAQYPELTDVLERLIAHEQIDADQRLALWIELAQVLGDVLMESTRAIDAWKNVISLAPGSDLALENLERLFLQEGLWAEAAQVLEIKIDRTDDPREQIDLLMQIGDLWEHKLLEPNRAAQFYQAVLDVDPTNAQAGGALESIYTGQDDPAAFQSLVELYLTRAEVVDTDAFSRAETLGNAARIFEQHLGQPESALLVLLSAWGTETLGDEGLSMELERLAEQTGHWGELVGRANDILLELGESLDAADLRRQVGYWYADRLGQPDEAIYHLRRAMGIEPDSLEILERLESLYSQLAAWPEMADIMRRRIELTGAPDDRIDLWRRLGELCEMQMGEVDEAVDAYRQILRLDESDILAMESLERIFAAYDRAEDLVAILRQKADATYDPDQIVAIKEQIAQIYEQSVQDPQAAVAAYRDVLSVDQAHQSSLAALERLYLQTESWQELVNVYEQTLSLAHDPQEQIAIYGKLASVHENQFEDANSAIDAYNNILMVDPDNAAAILNLERLYRGHQRWFDLVEVLSRHAEIARADAERVEVFNDLARVRRDELDDPHGAIEAFTQSVQLDVRQPAVFMELAALHEQTDNYELAVDAYARLVALVGPAEERAEIYMRIGEILEHQLLSDERAESAYLSTLELMAGHVDAIGALRRIAERKQDWQPFIRVLKLAEQSTRDLRVKAEYLAEIGVLYEREIGDQLSALNYYESALENDAGNVTAAEPLIEMYIREQKWERAVPLLQLVIESYGRVDTDPEKLHHLHLHAGTTYARLAQREAALQHFLSAYEYDANDFDTLKGLGDLLFWREDFEKAAAIFQSLEYQHLDKLSSEEMIELYRRCGQIRRSFGENRRAVEYFIKALDIDGYDRDVLRALVELNEEQQNWEALVEYSRRLLETEEEPAARFALLTRMGDLWAGPLGDANRAVMVYQEALESDPESVSILRKLLDLYTRSGQLLEAIDVLKRLIETETNASRKAKYYYAIAVIFRDELGQPMEAWKYFDAALDQDVKLLKAFEAIERIATSTREWKELERGYRRMIHRVTEQDDGSMEALKLLLWSNLGEIYRSRLGHIKSAISAYMTAAALNPGDVNLRLILAELYEKAEDPQGAVAQHKELIKHDPFRTDSYRALFRAYMLGKEYDKAWCMAAALSYLKRANEQEEKFYQQYLGQNLPAAKGQFRQETFQLLTHPEQDLLMSYIMGILAGGLRGYYSRNIKGWGVHHKRDKLDLNQQVLFCKVYNYVARVEALVPVPEVYLKRDAAMGVRNANSEDGAVIIGADVTQGKSDRELAFMIGKQLYWMRLEHYLGSVGFPTENLKLLFLAAMHVTDPNLGLGQQLGPEGARVIQELSDMQPTALANLRKYMQQFLTQNKNPNLSEWLVHVEHSAIRMGLVLCGDLHVAVSCIANDAFPIGKATVKERVQELVLFAISDEYFAIRQALGLAIG